MELFLFYLLVIDPAPISLVNTPIPSPYPLRDSATRFHFPTHKSNHLLVAIFISGGTSFLFFRPYLFLVIEGES
jgi:hypothetical protein